MNTYNITDEKLVKSYFYQEFIKTHPGKGNLKIHAYAASEALPVSGLHIIVSTSIDGNKVVFFDGETDASGMIQTLSLPTTLLELNNLEVPIGTSYLIETDNSNYSVNLYDGVCVVQNINYIPGGNNGK